MVAVPLKEGMSAKELRQAATASSDANQARRLLALAAIRDGLSRQIAARIGARQFRTESRNLDRYRRIRTCRLDRQIEHERKLPEVGLRVLTAAEPKQVLVRLSPAETADRDTWEQLNSHSGATWRDAVVPAAGI
jgi:putative transposase